MASITLIVCDECVAQGRPDPSTDVHSYTVQSDTRRAALALCDEHCAPLQRYLDLHNSASEAKGVALDVARMESLYLTEEALQALQETLQPA